jgi:riboflavin synthase alpha subunit
VLSVAYHGFVGVDGVLLHILGEKPDENVEVFLAPVFLELVILDHSKLGNKNLFSLDSMSSITKSADLKAKDISRL